MFQAARTNGSSHPRAGESPGEPYRQPATQGYDRAASTAAAGLPEAAAERGAVLLPEVHHAGDGTEPEGVQTGQEAVGAGGQDHGEAGEAAEGGTGEEKETEAPGNDVRFVCSCAIEFGKGSSCAVC